MEGLLDRKLADLSVIQTVLTWAAQMAEQAAASKDEKMVATMGRLTVCY